MPGVTERRVAGWDDRTRIRFHATSVAKNGARLKHLFRRPRGKLTSQLAEARATGVGSTWDMRTGDQMNDDAKPGGDWVDRLKRSTFFRALELVGMTAILVSVGLWLWEADARRDARHNAAWTTIYLAAGFPGDGGRVAALETLKADAVSLAGTPLGGASLREIDLTGANLTRADLTGADLSRATLKSAVLLRADLRGAKFFLANLDAADLRFASTAGAAFVCASLVGARLTDAGLTDGLLCKARMPDGRVDDRDCGKVDLKAAACPAAPGAANEADPISVSPASSPASTASTAAVPPLHPRNR